MKTNATLNFYGLPAADQIERISGLANKALIEWGMNDTEVALLKYRENAVFSVNDLVSGKKYAIRIHRAGYHSNAELLSELQFMQALDHAGIHTPDIIPANTGELFVTVLHPDVPEPRQVDLLEWIDGSPIGTIENDGDATMDEVRANHVTAGSLAARIHNFTERWALPDGFTRRHWDASGLCGDNAHFGTFWKLDRLEAEQKELLLCAREKAKDELAEFGKAPDRYGLTHADFLPENFLYDGKTVNIIDFDDCGFGWHIMDLATSLFFLIGEESYNAAYDGLIEGYRRERNLPDAHLKKLPVFFLVRSLSYLSWIQSRQETETAKEIGPGLVKTACVIAEDYLRC